MDRQKKNAPNTNIKKNNDNTFNIKFSILLISLILLAIAYYIYDRPGITSTLLPTRKQSIFNSLNLIVSSGNKGYNSVSVGYNSCLDLIVRALELISILDASKPSSGVLHDKITSKEELLETFLYSFEHGSAAERFIENEEVCKALMNSAYSLKDKLFFTGGNAALMGLKFASEGIRVILGGAVGNESKRLLPQQIKIANKQGKDEYHLIMEFSRGEKWGTVTAPRDNRLIVHCDYTNSRVSVLEEFHSYLESIKEKIDLLIIAGLHLLEREEPSYRTARLTSVVERIHSLTSTVPIHLELASIADLKFLAELGNTILPEIDSMGLNEQELGFLYYSLKKNSGDINNDEINQIKRDFKDPTIETVSNALMYIISHVHKFYEDNNKNFLHHFGRIHFHSLKYHIVAQKLGTGWLPGNVSVAAGALTASVQACQFDIIKGNVEEEFILPFDELGRKLLQDDPVQVWTQNDVVFYIAPVLVCKSPTKTVGLGDAISSMGLLYHEFKW